MKPLMTALNLCVITGVLLTVSQPATARIKCWTNAEGIRECGDQVPPEFSQKGHTEISRHGVAVGKIKRAKTPEELEAERQAELKKAEQARLDAEQAKHDRVLLDTFSNVDDMTMARDGKIVAITSKIKLVQSQLVKLNKALDEHIRRAAKLERNGKQTPDDLKKDIDLARRLVNEKLEFIQAKKQEIQLLRETYAADINRFKELKGRAASEQQGTTTGQMVR